MQIFDVSCIHVQLKTLMLLLLLLIRTAARIHHRMLRMKDARGRLFRGRSIGDANQYHAVMGRNRAMMV